MKILFLTIGRMESIEDYGIYPDLLRCFRDNGHDVYTVSPYEKRRGMETSLSEDGGVHMLHVKIGNITKCGIVEKGISTLQIEGKFLKAIKKYFGGVKFDLVMYSTPPITFEKVIKYIKRRDNASSYLLLKDIFPQNAVDIGMMTKNGVKCIMYKYFRKKEERLYKTSDFIGCMSPANVEYLLKNNSTISKERVEVCPNSISPRDMTVCAEDKGEMRKKYGIPNDKTVFIYGGNLGKPQGIPFLIKCLESQKDREDVFFLVVGDGTEYKKIEEYVLRSEQKNLKLMKKLPKEDYDRMVGSCDVGLIFIDSRFTIPNFPSRLLSYMQAKLPVISVTDANSDIGSTIENGGFGWSCTGNSVAEFDSAVKLACDADRGSLGERAWNYLNDNYTVDNAYGLIMNHFDSEAVPQENK